ncbi:twin-arginine translocation signal domain-containing protein [Glycomyces harbinensis]|uniref:Tat (Twin-arginine translocation) pathway signal sequence n=1 Tax=Glycomyces harbinensis TaxID=58114 RepID=A0A1G6WYG6_9ACTN|nr:twin-arginine translocation signal domain-containing protein [Glycomyces harbinensis]SDD70859.1 Tat (twin-arginine translocation) pathway signal sequence [Glycomyces harbinensis]
MHEPEKRPPMPPPLSRRHFLMGASAAAAMVAIGNAGAPAAMATSQGTVLPLVAPLPAGRPVRSQFASNEQVLAAYLMILAPLANSVRDIAPNYGWMEDGWQRNPNEPYNARIMEHVATLSWFYANDRTWNPYYRDPALLGRLDAALGHYLSLQHADGSYPEYSPTEHHLSPTGFGTVALSAVLRDLRAAGELYDRRLQIRDALRKSSAWLVDTSRPHWNRPVQFANQVLAGLSGVAEAAHILGEPAVSASVPDRLQILLEDGQAPAGFFHEPVAPDAGYNFEVMLPDLGALYKRLPDPAIIQLAERFAEWWGYIVVMEPGRNEGFILSATSARNIVPTFETTPEDDLDRSALARTLVPHVPALGAFFASSEEKTQARDAWRTSSAPVSPRQKQDSSPRLYMHVPQAPLGVTSAQRNARVAEQRYRQENTFTELRKGTLDQQYVFVRRPGYYTAAVYGVRPNALQRMGTNSFWHPTAGMLALTVNSTGPDDWTTVADTVGTASSRGPVTATHHAGASASGAVISPDALTGYTGVFTTKYVTADGAVRTDVTHRADGIRRVLTTPGASRERIPLIVGTEDQVVFANGTAAPYGQETITVAKGLTLTRGGLRFTIDWGADREAKYAPMDRSYLGNRTHRILTISFSGTLSVDLRVTPVS